MGRKLVNRSRFSGYKGMARVSREANQRLKDMEAEKVPGGLSAGKTIEDIAIMHGSDLGYAKEQLEKGIKVEMEHTNDENVAREIAMDHLVESLEYYIELEKMEKKLDAQNDEKQAQKDQLEQHIQYFQDAVIRPARLDDWEYVNDEIGWVATVTIGDETALRIHINQEDSGEIIIDFPDNTSFAGDTSSAAEYINLNLSLHSTPAQVPITPAETETQIAQEKQDAMIDEGVKTEFDSELEKINHIRKLIDEKGADILKYSAKELVLLDSYTGMGGQAKKVERGTHDVGILDQFYTPYFVIEKMFGLALKHGFKYSSGKKILEPSCGIGKFFEYVPLFCQAVGYEIDKYAATIAKLKFPSFTIINDSFETIFFNKLKKYDPPAADFDLVIGNPPYRDFTSKWAVIEDAMHENEKTRTSASTYDQYFMMRGVDLLKQGGLLIFIIPNTFLSNDNKYNSFKNKLNEKAELIDAYRLPNKLFNNTDISTDIIVLKKR